MNKEIELLAPAGDFECLKAAVQNGADSVYFGGSLFNARASATNFDYDELEKVINYCAIRNVKTHLTLNTLIKDSEFKDAVLLAKKAYELGIDAIIVQDLGLAKFLIKNFPNLPVHASTQMTVHNLEGVKEIEKLGFKRAVLSRELSANEIEYICNNSNIEIETFIHGALCISYSGQCLFSSMVGGRSGNRGRCAQPCRLPYTLVQKDSKRKSDFTLNHGYLLSTRDLCGLNFLPTLINAGVKCFKIEGRMKSPEYVATVTRIYRKYIDLALSKEPYIVDDNDLKELMQVFNRGGFSTGHLDASANHDLIYKEKPNNMGLYLGNISNYNPNKGHVTLTLNENIAIGDTINFKNENTKYTVSELMVQKNNVPSATVGTKVTIGRMKGKIKIGDEVYKLSSKTLHEKAIKSYTNCENIKVPLKCHITIKENKPIVMEVSVLKTSNTIYNGIKVKVISNILPEKAQNAPITTQRIMAQICKTTNTPYEFRSVDISLDDNLHIPRISALNELRRNALEKIEFEACEKIKRKTNFKVESLNASSRVFNNSTNNFLKKEISVLLRTLSNENDYLNLNKQNINRIYLPLRHFINPKVNSIVEQICNNFDVYIYMPSIIKTNYKNVIMNHLENIVEKYCIKGFVISNIADFIFLNEYIKKYDFVGNFTLNAFNSNTILEYEKLGIKTITLSPELSLKDINEMPLDKFNVEMVVYGNLPVMTTKYCLLGNSNKCYPKCTTRCRTSNEFYLKDRLGFEFRVLPDNIQTVTTIYNSKTTSITHVPTNATSLRIDILNEDVNEINKVVNAAISGTKLEGKQYTYGNLNREV